MSRCSNKENCRYPMFEQLKGYPGHWYCFHPEHLKKSPKSLTICNVPWGEDEYKALEEAKTPTFCVEQDDEPEESGQLRLL